MKKIPTILAIEDKWFDLKESFGKVGKTYDQN